MNPLTPLVSLLTRGGNDVPWQVVGDVLSFEIKRLPMCGFQVCLEKVKEKKKKDSPALGLFLRYFRKMMSIVLSTCFL